MPSKKSDWERWEVDPPESISHGVTEDNLSEKLERLMPESWHLEGNMLVGKTSQGILKQRIPTNYICLGTDDKGMPKLKRIDL